MDVTEFNRNAWNLQSLEGCRWSTPFDEKTIREAQKGNWEVRLTPNRVVPSTWFPSYPDLSGLDILGLASGGGQQNVIFAAARATVTSFDNSDVQLQKDEETGEEHGLGIRTLQGNMTDLSEFEDESFDIIFNPVSNVFSQEVLPIWRECHRVLRPGGRLMAGYMNPAFFLFDHYEAEETGELKVRYALPYSDLDALDEEVLSQHLESQVSLEFSHSWEAQIGGQCRAGLPIHDFFEDNWDDESTVLNRWMPMYAASLAIKPD
jgi:SAM-dependent methyltransferase